MSLPIGDELPQGEISSVCLYEAIRHAAIIYSVAVTFALPPLQGIFRKLAVLLKHVLEEVKLEPCWRRRPTVLLWILMMGGIAACDMLERGWYVQNLGAVAVLGISEWDDVAEELGNFLWLQSACDAGGRTLWAEVVQNRRIVEEEASPSL